MKFLGSGTRDAASNVLLGIPLDETCCFRPGTRQGPREIRYFSDNLETFSVELGAELAEDAFYDAGDLDLTIGNPETALTEIADAVGEILDAGKRPICLGGEHLVTGGIVGAFAERHDDLCILQIDAHYDLRQEWLGSRLSHATVIRQCWETCGMSATDDPSRLVQVGIRSGPVEEYRFAQRSIPQFMPDGAASVEAFVDQLAARWAGRPVYCTFDIDAIDPAYAPGTGTPEAGGLSSREALAIVRSLSKLDLVGFDLVEVSPPWDRAGITSALAAKMIRDLLISLSPQD